MDKGISRVVSDGRKYGGARVQLTNLKHHVVHELPQYPVRLTDEVKKHHRHQGKR